MRCSKRPVRVCRLVRSHGVTTARLIRAVQAALAGRPCAGLTVVIVNDREIARLHQQFMADPTPTDVLAFDLRDSHNNDWVEGEVVLSAETAERQAKVFDAAPAEELIRYAIHGTLHLAGYDDHTAAGRRQMRREEDRILGELAGNKDGSRHQQNTARPSKTKRRTASRAHH